MPKPTLLQGETSRVRIAILTLDGHLTASVARAEKAIRVDLPGVSVSVHPAAGWATDPAGLEAAKTAVAEADIVVGCMLFIDDQVQAILPALKARRDHCKAMLCCVSSAEIVNLTRMGRLDMSAEPSGPMAMLKRLRGKTKPGESKSTSGAGQMAMLKRLPKILKYIPGTAQDLRIYFLVMQYWLSGSDQNVENMLRLLVGRYVAGSRSISVPEPVEYPEVGVYHPRMSAALPNRMSESAADLPPDRKPAGHAGTVGLLLLRSYVLANDARHYDGAIAALESRGLRVVPAYASGLDCRPAIERFFMKDGRATVDAVVSLTGFSLVGGPAYNNAAAAEEILATLDVPDRKSVV